MSYWDTVKKRGHKVLASSYALAKSYALVERGLCCNLQYTLVSQ
ncbi:hypothetical protein ThidrDRAFT_0107 [Thiorhodococcus drewsii AZ1]|uniref:Uncharacterized protein n=1 Tax=Thiorhodococcus drewsii AZ1 TaxID=765913 RepID=G2DW46_9GAMM|nr:hypothetical protein ThidrDRAFT_0107 [Thiorhodococcus drewsii AZ1]